ncbi:MAG: ABC transporter ATP-binding protein [Thermodesulfobacteriota bacterium]|nr:ABC transporter ATP-binding protein [Thermodesulfobacteriota bacterium]
MLEVHSVSKYFGGLGALKEVDLRVNEGEFVGLIGPNGSGKTTLFNVLTGVLKPTSGKITFMGHDIIGLIPDKICHLGIARTFQIPRPFKTMSVVENVMLGVMFGGRYSTRSGEDARQEALRCLDNIGMKVTEATMPGELGVAGLRRLELGRALATRPKLLLLDEVISGLNAEEISEATSVLKRIKDEMGITIIWVEHIMGPLMNLVERVIVLDYGEVIAEGTTSEVSRDERVIEAYLGAE